MKKITAKRVAPAKEEFWTPKDIRSFSEHDPVHHPAHYTTGTIETLDFILDKDLTFLEGNVVKYIVRSRLKGNQKQDLEKALFYLNRLIGGL